MFSQQGLSHQLAALRHKEEGANEIALAARRGVLGIALNVLREPMFLLLVCAGSVYLLLGDVTDALMLLGFICIVIGITVYQEYKTERVLEALRDLTSPRALVIRDGIEQRIAGREVVRGDILILNEGDRVPADALLLECSSFAVDESLLTGESVAVAKVAFSAGAATASHAGFAPGGDNQPYIYAGTLVVQGHAIASVMAIGPGSEIGKIGQSMQLVAPESSPLEQEIRKLVRVFSKLGALICLMLVLLYGYWHDDWLRGLLSGITLAMSALPEEYPVVLTVFMAMGAWRISQHQVLTRRAPVVQALGAVTVLCVDKTGTLTLNHMKVKLLRVSDAVFSIDAKQVDLPETFHALLEYGVLASDVNPFDPMEKAIHALAADQLTHTEHIHLDWVHRHDYALSPDMLAVTHIWRTQDSHDYVVACKGAPEAVADLCHLPAGRLTKLMAQVNEMAAQGMRVLGVARARYDGREWPDIQHDFDFEWLGLIGLADPVRPTVAAALRECATAGVRVVMITGDYAATAAAIAQELNLDCGTGGIVAGPEISKMNDDTLRQCVRHSNIFARMVPAQKLRLVNALKASGEIVAMTGDGVNDAPALKAAHIGIAMGGRGSDVAREAAALVLLDDDFASIVYAIRLGRSIFNNLRKAMAYIFAVHIPIIGLSLIPLLLGWPAVFSPVHIVFLEMIINPACAIAFEAERPEADIMQRLPRNPKEPLFSKPVFYFSLAQGLLVLLSTLMVLGYARYLTAPVDVARTLTFSVLVISNIGLILVNRSWRDGLLTSLLNPNAALWWVIGIALAFLIAALYLPFLRAIFHFSAITVYQFLCCVFVGVASVIWFEWFKGKHW